MILEKPPELRTERLVLEPLRVDHAGEMVSVLADASLYEFTGGQPPDLDVLTNRYRQQVAGSGSADELWCNWIARSILDGRAIGFVQATVEPSETSVAWLIGEEHQGAGFAQEAGAAMIEWLESVGIERSTAYIAVGHAASERVATALGFAGTGELDEDGEQIWRRKPALALPR